MPIQNEIKRNEYRRKYYRLNSKIQIESVRLRKRKIRKWFDEYKSKLSCEICGENHPATIDFHHKDSSKKEEVIAKLVAEGYSIKKIESEMSKCKVLCSNCHRKLHFENKKL